MSLPEIFGAAIPPHAVIGLIGDSRCGIFSTLRSFRSPGVMVSNYQLERLDPIDRAFRVHALQRSRREGSSILLASWNEELLVQLADEVWWIDGGHLHQQGDPREVVQAWRADVTKKIAAQSLSVAPRFSRVDASGNGRGTILAVSLSNAAGQPALAFQSGELMTASVSIEFRDRVEEPVVGLMVRTRVGLNVYGTNTELEALRLGPREAGDKIRVTYSFPCDLCPGEYSLTIASHDPDGTWHEWIDEAIAFNVIDSRYTAGVANLRAKVSWELY
jgi:lipopolysaccharide transport system ATP-binding protein